MFFQIALYDTFLALAANGNKISNGVIKIKQKLFLNYNYQHNLEQGFSSSFLPLIVLEQGFNIT